MKTGWSISALTGAVAVGMIMLPALAPGDSDNQEKEIKPNGKGIGTLFNPGNGNGNDNGQAKGKPGSGGGSTSNGIDYHGGPLMTGTVNVYYIWYGDWAGNEATGILEDLAKNIAPSPYFNINTTYYNGANVHVSNLVSFKGSTTDAYSHGMTLSDAAVQDVVKTNIGKFGTDVNGVYFVLTSADVTASSGFCTKYCGWHTFGTINGLHVKYSFVGDPTRCPSACMAQKIGPNGASGADGMASIIAHELEEATTDPELNAWYDSRGMENADKCAWTFGATYAAKNGTMANMTLGLRDFLIQQNWVNASGGFCAKSY
jgi:hypothetical protein